MVEEEAEEVENSLSGTSKMLRMYVSWVRTVRITALLRPRPHRTASLHPTKIRKPMISESEKVSKTVNEAEDVHRTGGRKMLLVI